MRDYTPEQKAEWARRRRERYHASSAMREDAKARAAKWMRANPAKFRENQRRSREKHIEARRASQKAWWSANSKKAADYRLARTADRREYSSRYRANHPDRLAIVRAEYRSRNKEKIAAYSAARHRANPELSREAARLRRARKKGVDRGVSGGLERTLFAKQKGRCACCRANLRDTGQHLDHVVPLASQGEHADRNLQLLCPACNLSKGAKDPVAFMQSRGFLL